MISAMPIISVIVPVYKVEPYLRECIDSILNQTFKDFELILVDDGSPDNCPVICDEYAKKDSRVVVIHKENGGVSSARNEGLNSAKGEFISFVDGDDYLEKEYLETLYLCIRRNNSDLSRCRAFLFEDFNKKIIGIKTTQFRYTFHSIEDKSSFIMNVFLNGLILYAVWGSLFKRDIIKNNKISFPIKITMAEDLCFMILFLSSSSSIELCDRALYYYRCRDDSAVHSSSTSLDINDSLIISKYIKDSICSNISRSLFYEIHNFLVCYSLLSNVGFSKIKDLSCIRSKISSINDKNYFCLFNGLFYNSYCKRKNNTYSYLRKKVFYKYLADLKYGALLIKTFYFRLLVFPFYHLFKRNKI